MTLSKLQANGKVSADNNYVGGLFGYLDTRGANSLSITDIDNSATVISAGFYTGGLTGSLNAYAEDLVMDNIHATGDISGTNNYTGGLIGYAWINEDATFSLTNSYASGQVDSTTGGSSGGLIGYVEYEGAVTLTNVYATGAVSGSSTIGGLIGNLYDYNRPTTMLEMDHVYATGDVTATSGNAGGR